MTPAQMHKILEAAAESGDDKLRNRASFIRKRVEELAADMDTAKAIHAAEEKLRIAQEALTALRNGQTPPDPGSGLSPKERLERTAYLKRVRDWAFANNHFVKDRGRIPGDVIEMFERAKTRGEA